MHLEQPPLARTGSQPRDDLGQQTALQARHSNTISGQITSAQFSDLTRRLNESWGRLSPEQAEQIRKSILSNQRQHGIDFKASIPIAFGKRFYVRFLFGQERRNFKRIKEEGQAKLTRIVLAHYVLIVLILGHAAFGVFIWLYLLKSYFRVDFFSGPSILHPLFVLFLR
ncbi:MAG: hypothetical protein AAFV69_01290 [Pseudomonadota bacterium]